MIVDGIQKPDECIRPDSTNCRGCSMSFAPELYDGGCMAQKREQGAEEYIPAARRADPSFYRDNPQGRGEVRKDRNRHAGNFLGNGAEHGS